MADSDFGARLTAVESGVATARSDAAAARTDAAAARELAAGAHADVSDVKLALAGHFRVLNALRETQLEQGRRLSSLEGKVGSLEGKVGSLEVKVDQGFSMLNVGMAQITALLTNLIRENGERPPGGPDSSGQDGPSATG